jgi:hypothetical protein
MMRRGVPPDGAALWDSETGNIESATTRRGRHLEIPLNARRPRGVCGVPASMAGQRTDCDSVRQKREGSIHEK